MPGSERPTNAAARRSPESPGFSHGEVQANPQADQGRSVMTGDTTDAVAAAQQPTSTRPMTGAEYLESLRDGREICLYGERVADVTTLPAFRNAACMIARLYDALHDPALKEVLTTATDTGSEGYTH